MPADVPTAVVDARTAKVTAAMASALERAAGSTSASVPVATSSARREVQRHETNPFQPLKPFLVHRGHVD
jgi:hypothetical protein